MVQNVTKCFASNAAPADGGCLPGGPKDEEGIISDPASQLGGKKNMARKAFFVLQDFVDADDTESEASGYQSGREM